jgi:uncharacterized protein
MSTTWMQTRTGKAFDLVHPDHRLVDFERDVAPALGKLARYAGHTVCDWPYTVAQHCELGAYSLYGKTGSDRLAALFLLHDAHEAYMGDVTTPVACALEELGVRTGPPRGDEAVKWAIRNLKYRLDWAIHKAAGVPMPTAAEAAVIEAHDIAMMAAERQVLMVRSPLPWGEPYDSAEPAEKLDRDDLEPWGAVEAAEMWLDAFHAFIAAGAR